MTDKTKEEIEIEKNFHRITSEEIKARQQGVDDANALIAAVREVLDTECTSYCCDNADERAVITRKITMRLLRDGWRRHGVGIEKGMMI